MNGDKPSGTVPEQEPDYRFTLANERTFLAWNRTALALIAAGVAVIQFVPAFSLPGLRHVIGVALIGGGGMLALLAVRRWRCVQVAMRNEADLPTTKTPILLAIALAVVALLILVAHAL